MNWKKIIIDILKYAGAVILGAAGYGSVSGCASIPVFFF